jgi:DNA (cytosine-5)-methyltransferase 1
MAAYYNEIDPYAAQWLRNLIAAGHIADGVVDSRSIIDVKPDDLKEFTQCHFFAGVGVWSRALRMAQWPDTRRVWTGSCPCQPFSMAGAGGGVHDERHLWPHWHWLIEQCQPEIVLGEQVEAAIRHGWLDLVQSDMEGIGYAFAAAGVPAAGVGAPHIRQRLWFVAHHHGIGQHSGWVRQHSAVESRSTESGFGQRSQQLAGGLCEAGRVDHHHHEGLERFGRGHQAASGWQGAIRSAAEAGESGGLADATGVGFNQGRAGIASEECDGTARDDGDAARAPGPTNGHWRDADWLYCRDGKFRPVEPGTFPLAHGAPARVGRLRAYGNAIVAQVAQTFIECVMEALP